MKCLEPSWNPIDEEAKDLLKRMLTKDPVARITAAEAVKHPWFKKYESSSSSKEEQNDNLIQSLRNLKNFGAETVLQKAVLAYIASQEIDPQEEKRLKQLFDTLDADKSGQVTYKDLLNCYSRIYKDKAKAQKISAHILKQADFNNNGCIDYNGMFGCEGRVFDGYDGNK